MPISRRDFLARSALALAAGAATAGCARPEDPDAPATKPVRGPDLLRNQNDWDQVRDQFALSPDYIHMSAMYVASHPRAVQDAIDTYRRGLDSDPVAYLNRHNRRRINEVLAAAADYLGADEPSDIALTDSTTMGIGLVYNGLQLPAGSQILSTTRDYYATHEALRLASLRNDVSVRQVPIHHDLRDATEDSVTQSLVSGIVPQTRALALTWVHSGTGLKLPLPRIAEAVARINRNRDEADQLLVCVDGVHGFGVEDFTIDQLGCDFFMAGCHKWLFGPRGTGVVWGSPRGWENVVATVPSFHDDGTRNAWLTGTDVDGRTNGRRMSPGGFKPFEHQWAVTEAFALHQRIGKARVAARTHELARQLKEGLRQMSHVTLQTPMAENLSSGIVCFDVAETDPFDVVARLRQRKIIGTVTPYAERHVRFAPSIRNSPAEVEAVLAGIHSLR